jgi:hypothetical protein
MMRVKSVWALASRHGVRRNLFRNCVPHWWRTVARRWRQHGLNVHPVLGELLLMLALTVWLLWENGVG